MQTSCEFFKSSLKMEWLDFVIVVNVDPLFSSDNCDFDHVYENKLMIFDDKIFSCKVDGDSTCGFLAGRY